MNNNSNIFELPGNTLGIPVPTINRPINPGHLAAIRNYKALITSDPANNSLKNSLDTCYESAFWEFTHDRGLDSCLDAILEAIRINNQETNSRLDGIDTRLDGIDTRLDRVETILDNSVTCVNIIAPQCFLRWPMDFPIPRKELPLTKDELNALQVSELDRILLAWDLPVNGNMKSKRLTIYNRVRSNI